MPHARRFLARMAAVIFGAVLAATFVSPQTPLAAQAGPTTVAAMATGPTDLAGHWSATTVLALQQAGVLTPSPTFAPTAPIASSDWQVWICQALAWPQPTTCPSPPAAAEQPPTRLAAVQDLLPLAPNRLMPSAQLPAGLTSHPGSGILKQALTTGLLTGDPLGRLDPDRILTRAEAAVLIGRLVINRQADTAWHLEPEQQTPLDRLRLLLHPELSGPQRHVTITTVAGETVASPVRVAESSLALTVGAEYGLGAGLLLRHTSAIHTRWGPVPLDVVFLNDAGKILDAFSELPRGVTRGALTATQALELPGGAIARLRLQPGAILVITSGG